MDKRVANADVAIERMRDGASIMMGGFGLCGVPNNLIEAVRRKGVKDLTVMSNNAGTTATFTGLFKDRDKSALWMLVTIFLASATWA